MLAGIDAARAAGFTRLKIDTVVIRGTNDDEIAALVDYGRGIDAEVRLIEYMDVGGATRWSPARLEAAFGPIEPIVEASSAPAARFRLSDGTTFGIISSTRPSRSAARATAAA